MSAYKILYICPQTFYGEEVFLATFIRISNFLNAHLDEIPMEIEEEYVDLRFEDLPQYSSKNKKAFRESLSSFLSNLYENFPFDLVAIGCFTSYMYLNSVEIAYIIKSCLDVKKSIKIVVGGYHPSVCPMDFQVSEIPSYIKNNYNITSTPFDYLIREEAELAFLNLVKQIFIDSDFKKKDDMKKPFILSTQLIENLNEIPIIDYSLYKKYKANINKSEKVYLEFSRGCAFNCHFCPVSGNIVKSYKNVRYKSIEKCIEELKVIRDTEWLKPKHVIIVDPTFLPKKEFRDSFLDALSKIEYPFHLAVNERIDTCEIEKFPLYNKLKIRLLIGLETGSPTLHKRFNKFPGSSTKKIRQYLEKTKQIIIASNKYDVPILFNYFSVVPGSTWQTYMESENFFFKPLNEKDGRSLSEKYKIDLIFATYAGYRGSKLVKNCKKRFGAKIYYKEWWKKCSKNQAMMASSIDPSSELSFPEALELAYNFGVRHFRNQRRLSNEWYSVVRFMALKTGKKKAIELYYSKNEKDRLEKNLLSII
ncbi:MAG: radical SAM protein [Promethearchaeota archaeon]|nr:MAG: radical SAM protein [Candidatus Lokiarchaeota archaeon]